MHCQCSETKSFHIHSLRKIFTHGLYAVIIAVITAIGHMTTYPSINTPTLKSLHHVITAPRSAFEWGALHKTQTTVSPLSKGCAVGSR